MEHPLQNARGSHENVPFIGQTFMDCRVVEGIVYRPERGAIFNQLLYDMITCEKTTYLVEGVQEPCFEVSDGFTMVRIAKMYHYLGGDTLEMTEFLDGQWNGSEEWKGDFDSLTERDAIRLVKEYSAYLN